MSGKKKTTQNTNTTQSQTSHADTGGTSHTTYDWLQNPGSADIDAYRSFQPEHNPAIPYAFSRARGKIAETYANPLGGNFTPELNTRAMTSQYEDLAQEEAQALREENYGLQSLKSGQLSTLASLTQPRLEASGQDYTGTQSGTTSGTSIGTGTAVQSSSPLDSVVQGALGLGSSLIL